MQMAGRKERNPIDNNNNNSNESNDGKNVHELGFVKLDGVLDFRHECGPARGSMF